MSQEMPDSLFPKIKDRLNWLGALVIFDSVMFMMLFFVWDSDAQFLFVFTCLTIVAVVCMFLKRSIDRTIKEERKNFNDNPES